MGRFFCACKIYATNFFYCTIFLIYLAVIGTNQREKNNMTTQRLAERLSAARQRRFVGRNNERSVFQTAITAPELPFMVMHLSGPGGIGKTTLMREFASICEQNQILAYYIDTRNVDPSPEPFLEALRIAMNLSPEEAPLQALNERARRQVILLDTYENISLLDGWIREYFLPQLPTNILIVMAGRYPPGQEWRADPGWDDLLRVISLRNLNPQESRDYLSRREIPSEQHTGVLGFTHGHPLALSLVADVFAQRHELRFNPEVEPDIVKVLLERLVQKVPGPAHRTALEACALVRLTTEPLLANILHLPDAHELFNWLRGLSFIESGRQGIFPHDLAREALIADLRWRNPDWFSELHNRARQYYATRIQQGTEQEQQRTLIDYMHLHRDNPVLRPYLSYFPGHDSAGLLTDIFRSGDAPELLAMVEKHEGAESAQHLAFWLDKQPQGVMVLRDSNHQLSGFMLRIDLHEATPADIATDPATSKAWKFLQSRVPLRPGEKSAFFRFWMSRDDYQSFSYVQSLLGVNVIRYYLTTPGLAYTFFPCADPDAFALVFAYADLERIPEADYEIGGHTYGMYGHNWRTTPPMSWLALLAERELSITPQVATPPKPAETLVVLSEPDFAAAVRDVLRDYTRPDAMRNNPLLQSRLVIEKAGSTASLAEKTATLRAMVSEAAESLQAIPRDTKLYRVLRHTYLHPAPTQEQAAELLDLPFSTFRRHLKSGVTRVTEVLWQWEIQGKS